MGMEPEVKSSLEVGSDRNSLAVDNGEANHIAISMKNETSKAECFEKSEDENKPEKSCFSERVKRSGRLAIFFACIAFLIIGRYSVPDNEIKCIEDKLINGLQFANSFINANGNQYYRDLFQILCSLLVDTTFIITFGYWMLRGTSGRLPMTLAVFLCY